MRKSLKVLTAFIFMGAISVSFLSNRTNKHGPGNPDGYDKIADNLFIADAFFAKYNLTLGPQTSPHIKDWSSMDRANKFGVVDDIRWEFDDAAKAADYHAKNLKVNSESGLEIQSRIYIPGVMNLHVYRESKSITDLNKEMGIDTKEFYFLFTIDKVVAKVFVSVNGDVSADDASVFPKEAAKTIKKALGIK
jgi:hypothetical protein